MSYVLVFLILQVLILLHELGHLLVAKRLGIPIARFSIGFGPRLWGFEWRGTDYCLSAVPLGGYVLPDLVDETSYFDLPLGRRIGFALGGPAMNLILALPLFALLNAVTGGLTLERLFVAPFVQTGETLVRMAESIPLLFQRPDAVSGVVGIVHQGGEYVGLSAERAIYLAIVVSLNLGIFNLLPLPLLDGGKVALDLIHRFQPRVVRYVRPVAVAGLVLLLALFLYATVVDVQRIVTLIASLGSAPRS